MKRFTLQLEALSGRDMPSAGWASDVLGGSEPVAEVQRSGGLAGGIGGDSVTATGGLAGGIEPGLAVGVAGGLRGGVVLGGAAGGIVMGGLNGGVVLGGPDDPSTPIDVDGARAIGEEIPSANRSKGEEIPSFMSVGRWIGEEIPT